MTSGYDDWEAFCFVTRFLLAANTHASAPISLVASPAVSRRFPSRRLDAGSLSFAGLLTFVCLDDAFELAAVDGVVATELTAARFGGDPHATLSSAWHEYTQALTRSPTPL
jgi:hypothetical protein